MGFFSRIKKLWGSSEPQGKAISETEASDLQAPSSPGPENVLVAEDQQPGPKGTLEASGREDRLLHGNAEPAAASQPRLVQSAPPVAKEPAAEKSGGWRRLFGLDTPKKEDSAPATQQPELLFQEKPSARAGLEPWQEPLVQALGEAEPRLSVWMTHILDGVDRRGELLWNRLRFLFSQLDVPAAESEDFIHRFEQWLADMDYDHVDEFRSELQYRMALALDLEDEEDERNRLLLKLSAGLGKTREQLTMRIDQLLAMTGSYDDEFWEELEEILLVADVGVKASQELLKRLKPKVRKAGSRDAAEFKTLLKEELAAVFVEPKAPRVPQPRKWSSWSASTARARPQPSPSWRTAPRCRDARSWWRPGTPSGPRPSSSCRSGPSASGPGSTPSPMAATPRPWPSRRSTTPCRKDTTFFSSTRPAVCRPNTTSWKN